MNRISLLTILLLINTICVFTQAPAASIKAKFTVTTNSNDTSVSIINKSSNKVNKFLIDFGDGTVIVDTQLLDYTHKYSALGVFHICLTVSDTTGLIPVSAIYCDSVEFTQQSVDCASDFNYVMNGLNVTVNNISNGSYKKLIWNFGDGVQVKNKDSVSHTYKKSGAYDINLLIKKKDTGCESKKVKTIIAIGNNISCIASYTYLNDSVKRVIFTNQSIGASLTYQWDFGDGTFSNENSPVHEYNFPGIYKVILVVETQNHLLKSDYLTFVSVDEDEIEIMSDFEAISDPETDTVEFINISIGNNISSYIWDFGDGNVSNDTSPLHIYQVPGDYSVCLSSVPKTGKAFNTVCKNITAGISHTNLPDFSFNRLNNDSVSFVSEFCYTPDSLLWDFGDNNVSLDTQPIHHYSGDGLYLVGLKLKYNSRIYENIQLVNITPDPRKLVCKFKNIIGDEASHLKAASSVAKFKGRLSGDVSTKCLKWDFGDGTQDSTNLDVTHSYDNEGNYQVCLTVSNYLTGDSDTYCDSVKFGTISDIKPITQKSITFSIYPNPAKEYVNLRLFALKSENTIVELYDLSGRMVSSLYRGKIKSGLNSISVQLNCQQGIYMLKVQTPTEVHSVKLLIE